MNNATTQSHIVWLDVIRTVAMLMVIGCTLYRSFLYLNLHSEVYRNINIGPLFTALFYGPLFLFSL